MIAKGLYRESPDHLRPAREAPYSLVIVSHRGPGGGGGVASGLDATLRATGGCWVACDGASRPYAVRRVPLNEDEIARYYRGYANSGLWPLCHALVERATFRNEDWDVYRAVNERFARAAAETAAEDGAVWVHDYQLALVPALLRQLRPDLRIGFFWHIPWPSPTIWRLCPQGREITAGMAAADFVGLHTESYVREFTAVAPPGTVARALPMGVDSNGIANLAADPATERRSRLMRLSLRLTGQRVMVAVDRCDYTKGIPQRLTALGAFFRTFPDQIGRVTFVQVASPTRAGIRAYERLRHIVKVQARRLNARLGRPGWRPVRLIARRLSFRQIVALYRLADVAVVTPLFDGMNLVAKEFCAARIDERGALVLSRTAGAAAQLEESIAVNPLDPDGVSVALRRALNLPLVEQMRRMRALRAGVAAEDIHAWLEANLKALGVQVEIPRAKRPAPAVADAWEAGLAAVGPLPLKRTGQVTGRRA